MGKILYLTYDGLTDPLGQSQVLPYLCRLAVRGYRFTVVSCEKSLRFSEHRSTIEKITEKYSIEWHPLPYTKNPPVLSTIMDVKRMRQLCVLLHGKNAFDMVHCRGHIPSLVGLYMQKQFGIRFLFDMRGFWADEKVDAGAWNLSNPVYSAVYRYFKQKEKKFLEQSDQVVCLTHKAYDELQHWKNVKMDIAKVTVIPCCVDTEHFDIAKISSSRKEELQNSLGIGKQDMVLSYLGSIGTWYMLDEMLDFFIALKKKVHNVRFLFITHDEHERIKQTAIKKGIPTNDIIIRPANRADVPAVLNLSTFSLFFIRPSYSKISSSPTKQGEIMAMGIPVICNAGVGDTDMIVEHYCSGKLVKKMDMESYDSVIADLLSSQFNTNNIRNGAVDFFSLQKGVDRYESIYKKVLMNEAINVDISK